ncbi:MAG TPA: hypothetical protein VFE45_09520, partial [Coriobacteriia bacterium]|nr:hypothetical protein [Coriobacteriia bacterium]
MTSHTDATERGRSVFISPPNTPAAVIYELIPRAVEPAADGTPMVGFLRRVCRVPGVDRPDGR